MADLNEKTLASLAKNRLFKGFDRAEVERMASFAGARCRKLAKGEVALHEGDRFRNLVVVLSGRLNTASSSGCTDTSMEASARSRPSCCTRMMQSNASVLTNRFLFVTLTLSADTSALIVR
jgi:hypothetical protein